MFKKNNSVIKMNGGGYYYRLSQILKVFLIMLFFAINVFAEIPHSYVIENPNKEVTQTETLKRKDKAELNLTITKKNSKEAKVERAFYNTSTGLFYMVINGKEYNIAPDDNLLISDKLEELPNLSTTNGRKKINKMFDTREVNYKMESNGNWRNIQTTFEELPKEVYINVLDRNYNLKDVLNLKDIKITRVSDKTIETEMYGTILEGYNGKFYYDHIYKDGECQNYSQNEWIIFNQAKVIKWDSNQHAQFFNLYIRSNDTDDTLKEFSINNEKELYNSTKYPDKLYIINNDLTIETIDIYENNKWHNLYFKFIKFPHDDFSFTVEEKKQVFSWNEYNKRTYYFTYKRASTDGESNLNIDNSYRNEYIKYDSCTIENLQPVSLLNPVQGVSINQVWGDGILEFKSGDTLRINGVQHTLNYSGLSEQRTNLNGIDLSYQVVNNKLQLKINGYEPGISSSQPLDIEVERKINEQGTTFTRKVLKHTINIKVPNIQKLTGQSNLTIAKEYGNEYIPFTSCTLENQQNIALERLITGVTLQQITGKGLLTLENGDTLTVNGQQNTINYGTLIDQNLVLNGINLSYKVENGKLQLRVNSYDMGIDQAQPLNLKINRSGQEVMNHTMFITVPNIQVISGESILEVKEYYSAPEYIAFNSCIVSNPKPIELENSLTDVKVIQNSGNGLVNLENGDILELNGKEYHIGVGGNLPEQQDTLGEINFKFKVENGKLRLALISWGVLEPDRILAINVNRKNNKLLNHKMIIKAPRRVEGISNLTFTEKYPLGEFIRFQGISLTAPNVGGIEPPIPAGVKYSTTDGYGIPFMKDGDILEIQYNTMRDIKRYTIDSKNSLKHQTIDLPGIVLLLSVENGKLRLGLNKWTANKNAVLTLKIIRGVNEISSTSLTLEVPKAQFDILKGGILDFGQLIQGSKNVKAETDILLQMHQDISEVNINLSTTTPELVNSNGAILHAKDLQVDVQNQKNRRYLVKIKGRLDVSEQQELGAYKGSALLNVEIK